MYLHLVVMIKAEFNQANEKQYPKKQLKQLNLFFIKTMTMKLRYNWIDRAIQEAKTKTKTELLKSQLRNRKNNQSKSLTFEQSKAANHNLQMFIRKINQTIAQSIKTMKTILMQSNNNNNNSIKNDNNNNTNPKLATKTIS